MGKTVTAHIAIGTQNEGGIVPTHVAWLFENSRPVWMLEPTRLRLTGDERLGDRPGSPDLIRWTPEQPETILADGLLLIAMHAFGQEDVLGLGAELVPGLVEMQTVKRADGVEVGCDLDRMSHEDSAVRGHLVRLREQAVESIPSAAKLVVTVLEGSSIERQVPILERYPMELETCTVTYSRQRVGGAWGPVDSEGAPKTWGSLEPRPDAPGHRYTEIRL